MNQWFSKMPSSSNNVTIMDRIFIAVFARYRRRLVGRSLRQAWSAATFHVTTFVYPATLVLAVPVFVAMSPDPAEVLLRPWPVYLLVIGLGLMIGYLLDRRFRRFLVNPPPLDATESTDDARLIWVFRWFAIGLFLVGCVASRIFGAYLMN